ncbi:hypothetical protein N8D74_17670 (plasmid) [Curtobacterium flaccumfaciens]|uniref:Uncharacterized protein n=1 Tax=Curtobacterium poinsettiae TaxID=159612 RepID=A0A9Q9PAH9_9MICO|nr:hypothetical protein [Curtobacterium flaccumfaciens]MBT1620556.1 hypothetical protein [Curtobacterium flaccumfaciens pv. poinsettiae]MCS6563587.1 hypothetical protein [Curtobacterium flaccumfaciens pv. poinsettiae]MCU0154524.1 hypothetical protein [Curtobacterium flaccumfaciens pv. poinsettiae]UXN16940.1 hypothetical protein N8D76_17295 [Curtobacterium flaccumfaciens pv. poinsettiae]UXN27209.1 hypothetical protein N8D74_17670 [Curtobacterium flaccumfaciens]
MDDELERLQWMSVDELAAARRSVIRQLNRLDRSQPDVEQREAVLQRVMRQIGDVQDGRRRDY